MERIKRVMAGNRRRLVVSVIIVMTIVAIGVGVTLWYQHSRYISTDNARISGALIPVASLSSSQVVSLDADVGSYVEQGQCVAKVAQPRASDSSERQGFKAFPANEVRVEAPVSGFVAAVWVYPGAIVNAGQVIITLCDSSNIWVTANVDETDIWRVRPGQHVEITVDSLGGMRLRGEVEGIAAATAATFSLLPQQNTSGNFIKVVQVVPVKIAIAQLEGHLLIPGTSVEVKIFTK